MMRPDHCAPRSDVEKNLAPSDDFAGPFQEAVTAWCWGFGWGRDQCQDTFDNEPVDD
jgi:hypothetical protein